MSARACAATDWLRPYASPRRAKIASASPAATTASSVRPGPEVQPGRRARASSRWPSGRPGPAPRRGSGGRACSAASRSPCWNFTKASRPCAQAMPTPSPSSRNVATATSSRRSASSVRPLVKAIHARFCSAQASPLAEPDLPERVQCGVDRLVGRLVLAAEHLGHALEAQRLAAAAVVAERGEGLGRLGQGAHRQPRPSPTSGRRRRASRSALAPREVSPSASASHRACSASTCAPDRSHPSARASAAAQQQLEARDRRLGTDQAERLGGELLGDGEQLAPAGPVGRLGDPA